MGPYRAVPCPCGDRACEDWHVKPVAAMQGVKFDRRQAELVAAILNFDDQNPGRLVRVADTVQLTVLIGIST